MPKARDRRHKVRIIRKQDKVRTNNCAGQLNDFGSGITNRVSGAVGGAVAGITGDRAKAAEAQEKHDVGKTQQRGAEHDIQKQNS